jgi:hypothetical protein
VIRKLAALLTGALLLGTLAFVTGSASASDSDAAAFVAKANAERQAHGLKPYAVASDLTAVARRHSQEMADKQSLYHNPNLGSEVANWQVVGENVGDGGSVDSIHQAFMDSPAHRANILAKDYTQVGIGTVTDAKGVIWVTQVFRLPYQATATVTVAKPAKAHTVVQQRVARPVTKPVVKPVVVKPAAKVAPAPVRVDPAAFVGALAQAPDAFGQAAAYADAMAALSA